LGQGDDQQQQRGVPHDGGGTHVGEEEGREALPRLPLEQPDSGTPMEEPTWWWGEGLLEGLSCPICSDPLCDAVETLCCHATYCRHAHPIAHPPNKRWPLLIRLTYERTVAVAVAGPAWRRGWEADETDGAVPAAVKS